MSRAPIVLRRRRQVPMRPPPVMTGRASASRFWQVAISAVGSSAVCGVGRPAAATTVPPRACFAARSCSPVTARPASPSRGPLPLHADDGARVSLRARPRLPHRGPPAPSSCYLRPSAEQCGRLLDKLCDAAQRLDGRRAGRRADHRCVRRGAAGGEKKARKCITGGKSWPPDKGGCRGTRLTTCVRWRARRPL